MAPTATQGTILNRDAHSVQRKSGVPVAAAVNITKGTLVYEDGSNGWKTVPTSSPPIGARIWFAETAGDNTASGAAKGDKLIDVWRDGAMVVGKADGAISVDRSVKSSGSTAGEFVANTEPATTFNATYGTGTEVQALRDYLVNHCGRYIGHLDEIKTNTSRTAAADGETDCVFLMGGSA